MPLREVHELFVLTLSLVWFAGACAQLCRGDAGHDNILAVASACSDGLLDWLDAVQFQGDVNP